MDFGMATLDHGQDPDTSWWAKCANKETAGLRSAPAVTVHQVFTPMGHQSRLGAFPRLLDIGMGPDIMAANISALRPALVCALPHCKESYAPGARERALG